MQQDGGIGREGGSGGSMAAASASLRRQLRMRNIVLGIIGAEAMILVVLRAWSGF